MALSPRQHTETSVTAATITTAAAVGVGARDPSLPRVPGKFIFYFYFFT